MFACYVNSFNLESLNKFKNPKLYRVAFQSQPFLRYYRKTKKSKIRFGI